MSVVMSNGPRLPMYKQPPVLDLNIDVKLPTCMYTYPKVFTADNDACDLVGLQHRQESIIQQLQHLVHQIDDLRSQLKQPTTRAAAQVKPATIPPRLTFKEGTVLDIVISCNPDRPCLSLLPLAQLLQSTARVSTAQHRHSSVIHNNIPQMFTHFTNHVNRADSNICLTLVWKQVGDVEFMVDPIHDRALLGETTLARYITNYLADIGLTNDPITDTHMDHMIDSLTTTLISGNGNEKAKVARHLNSVLSPGQWILGDRFSLVDIVVWSALSNANLNISPHNNIQRWLSNFNKKFSL